MPSRREARLRKVEQRQAAAHAARYVQPEPMYLPSPPPDEALTILRMLLEAGALEVTADERADLVALGVLEAETLENDEGRPQNAMG